jgi:hypothetical protein
LLGAARGPFVRGDFGPVRSPDAAAARLARLLIWPEADDDPPPWLLPAQARSFRRGLAAVRVHRGVLLADPVGSGKTFVSLAIAAAAEPAGPITVIAPAVLLAQWSRVAAAVGIGIAPISHERISRGDPIPAAGPVVIDESHRFRNPETMRYRRLAPALPGRNVVLVTATPVVNRLTDLTHQLLLAVRDDALRLHGIPSLALLASAGQAAPAALGRLVVRADAEPGAVPTRREGAVVWGVADPSVATALATIDRLRLSSDAGVAMLIRVGLWRALGSSPAALLASIRWYRTLIEHAAAARRAGRRVSRREVWQAAGAIPEQLVMWELLEAGDEPCDLAVGDRRRLAGLEARVAAWLAAGDRKTALLRALIGDRRPTVVFTGAIETVTQLRRTLAVPGVAWITGDRAGFGTLRAPRSTVLGAFGPDSSRVGGPGDRPWLLLATDVAAEGLDLQRAARVVHFDLPWTAVRLEQRAGRAVRRGSTHSAVEIVRFEPPPELERRLALTVRLDRKSRLPALVGLDPDLGRGWARSNSLAATFGPSEARDGWVVVRSADWFELVGAEITVGADRVGIVLGRVDGTDWTEDPALVDALLERTRAAPLIGTAGPDTAADALAAARPALERRLSLAGGASLLAGRPGTGAAVRRIEALAADDLRARRLDRLELVDRALRFLRRGHSAGEEALVRALARGDAAALDRVAIAASLEERPIIGLVAVAVGRPEREGEHG